MTAVLWGRYPPLAPSPHGQAWLGMQADLGLARNTIEAYGRALRDYFAFCERRLVAADMATRAHIAAYVRDLATRPTRRRSAVRARDAGAGPANATLQQ